MIRWPRCWGSVKFPLRRPSKYANEMQGNQIIKYQSETLEGLIIAFPPFSSKLILNLVIWLRDTVKGNRLRSLDSSNDENFKLGERIPIQVCFYTLGASRWWKNRWAILKKNIFMVEISQVFRTFMVITRENVFCYFFFYYSFNFLTFPNHFINSLSSSRLFLPIFFPWIPQLFLTFYVDFFNSLNWEFFLM